MYTETEKLLHAIKDSKLDDIQTLISTYDLTRVNGAELLSELIESAGYKKSKIAQHLGGTNYIYEICNGTKKPSRDKLLEILFFIHASLREIQVTLQLFSYSPLYPKVPRDIYILYAINNKLSMLELNDILIEKNMEPLF